MKKWDSEDIRSVVAFATALLPGVLTITIKNSIAQLAFLLLALLWLVIFYKGGKNKLWLGGLGICMAVILGVSLLGDGSPREFWESIKVFVGLEPGTPGENNQTKNTLLTIRTKCEQLEQQQSEEENLLDEISRQFENTSDSISVLMPESDHSRTAKEDRQEVEQILSCIREREQELIPKSFPHLTTSREEVERFYKTQLTGDGYHYENVIKALEEYGIDCKTLQVDKFDLARWDVEILYIFYRMKRSLEEELYENKFYERKEFNYRDFSIKDVEGYQDVFDYGGWNYGFSDKTAQELSEWFNGRILKYYDNFHLNFDNMKE